MWTGASWGTTTKHHPRFLSHGDQEPEWHAVSLDLTLTIVRQEGRSLQAVLATSQHEDRAVGVLSADGNRLELATETSNFHLAVAGDQLSGEATGRPLGSDKAGGAFSVGMVELNAIS